MLNRSSIILKLKQPAIDWINVADPSNDDPGITMEEANLDKTVYLIREDDGENDEVLQEWITLNYKVLFERELEDWYVDEKLWPKDRTLKLFHDWFNIESHSILEDTVGSTIVDDEI